jgi:uncharacterized protein
MVEMELVGVRVELPTNTPIVLLREREGDRRMLPIFIGPPEATAIAFALEQVATPRPMTHDLMKDLLDELGVSLERIVVTELQDSTFYAELHLVDGSGTRTLSSRPSDAIALASRTGSPIFAEDAVLDEVGYVVQEEAQPEEDVVEEFRRFIDDVDPEDFAS